MSFLLSIVLLTELLCIAQTQTVRAFSIDFSELPGFGDNQGLNFLQGPKRRER